MSLNKFTLPLVWLGGSKKNNKKNTITNDIFRSELNRLCSFDNWPIEYIDKHLLAKTGLFYSGGVDTVTCYFCSGEMSSWKQSDHPISKHIELSTNCPLLRRQLTNNIPINLDELDHVLPPNSYGVDSEGTIKIHPNVYPENSISTKPKLTLQYPEYETEISRRQSFSDWNLSYYSQPTKLAEAGFFYSGNKDYINCFACGGGFKDLSDDMDVWNYHAQIYGNCDFLIAKKGQEYIDSFKTNLPTPVISGNQLCKICYVEKYNTAIIPCGHMVTCSNCVKQINKCPMCRKKIDKILKIFF